MLANMRRTLALGSIAIRLAGPDVDSGGGRRSQCAALRGSAPRVRFDVLGAGWRTLHSEWAVFISRHALFIMRHIASEAGGLYA